MLPSYMVDSRVKNPNYDYGRSYVNLSDEEKLLIDNRDKAELLVEVSDGANYEYDDWALIALNGLYYVVNTSGCSCPDPADTWGVMSHGDKEWIVAYLNTTPNRRFQAEVAKLAGWEAVNTPEPRKSYDW